AETTRNRPPPVGPAAPSPPAGVLDAPARAAPVAIESPPTNHRSGRRRRRRAEAGRGRRSIVRLSSTTTASRYRAPRALAEAARPRQRHWQLERHASIPAVDGRSALERPRPQRGEA